MFISNKQNGLRCKYRKCTHSINEYPTKRPACEKNAIMIKFTCPKILVIFSAPYRNGILLTVPTVIVIPKMSNENQKGSMVQFDKRQTHTIGQISLTYRSYIYRTQDRSYIGALTQ